MKLKYIHTTYFVTEVLKHSRNLTEADVIQWLKDTMEDYGASIEIIEYILGVIEDFNMSDFIVNGYIDWIKLDNWFSDNIKLAQEEVKIDQMLRELEAI